MRTNPLKFVNKLWAHFVRAAVPTRELCHAEVGPSTHTAPQMQLRTELRRLRSLPLAPVSVLSHLGQEALVLPSEPGEESPTRSADKQV